MKAVEELCRLGLKTNSIHVLTSEPYHEVNFTSDPRESMTSRYALVGGIIGGAGGAALAGWTAVWVHLPTGGMPIVSFGPVGIITFALAGLGAVAGTILAMLRAAKLPDFSGALYDAALFREMAAGGLLLAICSPPEDRVQQVKQLLLNAGANPVK